MNLLRPSSIILYFPKTSENNLTFYDENFKKGLLKPYKIMYA